MISWLVAFYKSSKSSKPSSSQWNVKLTGLRTERGVGKRYVEGFILYMVLALTEAFDISKFGKTGDPWAKFLRAGQH